MFGHFIRGGRFSSSRRLDFSKTFVGKPIVKLRVKKCSRGCGAQVAEAGPCAACMTPKELRARRRKNNR
jgi:hypothetical protein